MTQPPPKILVYDGDCSLCRTLSRVAERRWLVGRAERRPHDAFEGALAARLADAGIHNELAVLDPASGEIRSGYDGIVWLLRGGRWGGLAALLGWGPVRWLLRHDYRLVAYNRRILAPPARSAACACDPDLHVGYRVAFLVAALLWAGLFAGVAAGLLLAGDGRAGLASAAATVTARGLRAAAAVVAGWVAACAFAPAVARARRLDLLGHLAWTTAAMVVPAILAVVLVLLGLLLGVPGSGTHAAALGGCAWAAALPIALVACLRRLPRLGLRRAWVPAVVLALWGLPTLLGALALPLR